MTRTLDDGDARGGARRNARTLWWLAAIAAALSTGTIVYVAWIR